ncbi:MAG: hypothetical protein ACREA4_00850 [Nitrososphaera sp.]
MSGDRPRKVATTRVFAAGTLLAVVISVPMIAVILVTHYVLNTDAIVTGVAGIVTLFAAMGFAYKLSKRLSKVQETDGADQEKK